ncbi:Zinc finger CCHC domain-containing protein 4 [Takifugu flavidus]|uniref:Zinc finger CCHC domain-containing protein 4 n=1 Tax=Takifugu flavidus TaxID=433684 RepID=A0A5C6N9I3_9TELE|nr:Zinc finger CCHC domain-containing protein 4 [Takifugu flavidus]
MLGYAQFYSQEEFSHYNMFNHHFFDGQGAPADLPHRVRGGKAVMVADPPFGGLVKPLANSFSLISRMWRKAQNSDNGIPDMPMIWIFPYFFEPRILECLPCLTMLDYQVDYDNHPLYKHGKTGRKHSPVRIFTNISPTDFVLPEEEGYRFCSVCQRFVWILNKHCDKCNICPSKDGREWKHCSACRKCVKPCRWTYGAEVSLETLPGLRPLRPAGPPVRGCRREARLLQLRQPGTQTQSVSTQGLAQASFRHQEIGREYFPSTLPEAPNKGKVWCRPHSSEEKEKSVSGLNLSSVTVWFGPLKRTEDTQTQAQKVQVATRDLLVFIHLISQDAKLSAVASAGALTDPTSTESPRTRGGRRGRPPLLPGISG